MKNADHIADAVMRCGRFESSVVPPKSSEKLSLQ
jgi:hypothetical protein